MVKERNVIGIDVGNSYLKMLWLEGEERRNRDGQDGQDELGREEGEERRNRDTQDRQDVLGREEEEERRNRDTQDRQDASGSKAPQPSSLKPRASLRQAQGRQTSSSAYVAHHGHPIKTLKETWAKFLDGQEFTVGMTGNLGGEIAEQLGLTVLDQARVLMEAVGAAFDGLRPRNIIDVGGGQVTLIRLNGRGEFEGMTQNSLCAAGTGGFLDEQATRLSISYEELKDFPRVDDPPVVATRCAVFAKSDLIHHQQAGRTRAECWSGLCRGMVRTLLSTLLKGRPLSGLTVMVGGVAQNPEILRRMKELYGDQLIEFPRPQLAGAIGAAMLATVTVSPEKIAGLVEGKGREESRALATRPALKLTRTKYPSWEVKESYEDEEENEVRLTRLTIDDSTIDDFAAQTKSLRPFKIEGYLGLDVGSTSTKLLLTDVAGEVICDIYRKTGGDPIGATRKLFDALLTLGRRHGLEFEVRGLVSTGSGRKMVGLVAGADGIVNEITCHVKGAMRVDPTIDTIFEIGGQDSKYMRTQSGRIRDAAMNYVCAAGTGSFVEEQARKLGYKVAEVGDKVMALTAPHTSDRCTVFMEQDVGRLLRAGHTREESLAAVMYSVAQNYLNKVVGRKPYSKEKIFFQGATARNPGLVAAFENLLGVEMVVSPYAHVMGAWGAALLARELTEKRGGATKFRGLDLSRRKIELRAERCEQCANTCEITLAKIEGETEEPSWGYMCGREPGEKKRSVREYRFFQEREKLLAGTGRVPLSEDAPKVVIPRALAVESFLPLWRKFWGELGYRAALSPATNAEVRRRGAEIAGGDFCFPVKVGLGHARWAAEREDAAWIFLPHLISHVPNEHTTANHFCPYVQSFPSVARTALDLHGIKSSRLLTPIVDLRWPEARQAKELFDSLGSTLGKSKKEIAKAWAAGLATYDEFQQSMSELGQRALQEVEQEDKPAILVLGRPYNTCDAGVNLGLVMKIAERGHTVIPLDVIAYNSADLGPEFKNLFWNFPQRIIHAVKKFRRHPRIFPVYFTNFNCGPDSFVETYADYLTGEKPMLVLGLDEHDADAGYLTRIEAFLDVVNHAAGAASKWESAAFPEIVVRETSDDEFKRRKIWIPNMHTAGAALGAAAFRSFGYDAEILPLETDESFEVGRGLTSGNECLPTVVTIGALVSKLRELEAKPSEHAFFMATAAGPCRFGQYALKHRLILDSLGYKDMPILSPSALNAYQGLPESLRKKIWTLFVASDILMKKRCRVAPYEVNAGETQRTLDQETARLCEAVAGGGNWVSAWKKSLARLAAVPQSGEPKPLVGIVGEIYVRCNAFTNDRVIESVERYGGEAWLAPLSEWFLYTAYLQKWRSREDLRGFLYRGQSLLKNRYLHQVEHGLYEKAKPWLSDRVEPRVEEVVEAGAKYLPRNFEGEAILTVGRALKFIEEGASLIVNCAPFGCMPGTITSSIFQEVMNQTGVGIVNMFYDGEGDQNRGLSVYLDQLRARRRESANRRNGESATTPRVVASSP